MVLADGQVVAQNVTVLAGGQLFAQLPEAGAVDVLGGETGDVHGLHPYSEAPPVLTGAVLVQTSGSTSSQSRESGSVLLSCHIPYGAMPPTGVVVTEGLQPAVTGFALPCHRRP